MQAKNKQKQIIAMGGGSFTIPDAEMRLERYVLAQVGSNKAKISFVPTASGESPEYVIKFYEAFGLFNCERSHFSFFKPHTKDLADYFLSQDVIYVGGGNTKSMLALWREWGVDKIMRAAWEQGVILCGVSAGMICWFEEGVTDSIPGKLTGLDCLGFLPGSACPHYDGEINRRPSYHKLVREKEVKPGLAADDGAALHYVGTELSAVVSSRSDAKAYRLELADDGNVVEKELNAKFLG